VPSTARSLGSSSAAQLKRLIKRLPAPRDRAALDVLRNTRALVTGKAPAVPIPRRRPAPAPTPVPAQAAAKVKAPAAKPAKYGLTPGPRLARTPKLPEDTAWTPFPPMPNAGELVRSLYETGDRPARFDVDLLEQLNIEYADKPIVAAPRSSQPKPMQDASRKRVGWAHNYVDLRDKDVLEIGCGRGYEVFVVAHDYGSRAHGVDVNEYTTWAELAGDRVAFTCADMTQDNPFPPESFDRVISYTVWEHVVHPRRLLQETYNVLKPGGLAWIRANLYAGPAASHRYREINFPWPHLLFSDDVISDWYVKNGKPPRGAAWVNRLSWNHYDRYIAEIGFRLRHLSFQEAVWDQEFYGRFEDILGRFPVEDLKRDYFLAVLERPA
jgi:SAM-dependent methyltransferase